MAKRILVRTASEISGDSALFKFRVCNCHVDTPISVLDLHFPEDPLVPAYLLVKTVTDCYAEIFSGSRVHIKRAKFLAPVRPEDEIAIEFAAKKSASIRVIKSQELVAKIEFGTC